MHQILTAPLVIALNMTGSCGVSTHSAIEQELLAPKVASEDTVLNLSRRSSRSHTLENGETFDFDKISQQLKAIEFDSLKFQLALMESHSPLSGDIDSDADQDELKNTPVKTLATLTMPVLPWLSRNPIPETDTVLVSQEMTTQENLSSVTTQTTQAVDTQVEENSQIRILAAHPLSAEDSPFVEAFASQTSVENVRTEMLTYETTRDRSRPRGWQVSFAPSHWSSLHWVDRASSTELDVEQTPLISSVTAQFLAKLRGVTLQADAGIVFGKVPAGWEVQISGRSERPLYLNSDRQVVDSASIDLDRTFVFLNTQPGAHSVYLESKKVNLTGSIAAPVLAGTGTYLDLTQISQGSLSGQVLSVNDSDSDGPSPLRRAIVRVLGQDTQVGLTDASGRFQLENVLTVSTYPLFVETDRGSGYTHRYRVLPSKMKNVSLFRFSKWKIHDWVALLEGGLSPESGLVIAVAPYLANKYLQQDLIPTIRSISSTPTLTPETYTLSPDGGSLLTHTSLSPSQFRFLGVEIPEGPTIAQVVDESGHLLWGELTVSSPNVISIIGP